jgi:hypothetical protein
MQILRRVAGSRCRPSCLLNPLVERILNGYNCPFLTIDQSILLLAASGALFVLGIASLTAVILEEDEVAPASCSVQIMAEAFHENLVALCHPLPNE